MKRPAPPPKKGKRLQACWWERGVTVYRRNPLSAEAEAEHKQADKIVAEALHMAKKRDIRSAIQYVKTEAYRMHLARQGKIKDKARRRESMKSGKEQWFESRWRQISRPGRHLYMAEDHLVGLAHILAFALHGIAPVPEPWADAYLKPAYRELAKISKHGEGIIQALRVNSAEHVGKWVLERAAFYSKEGPKRNIPASDFLKNLAILIHRGQQLDGYFKRFAGPWFRENWKKLPRPPSEAEREDVMFGWSEDPDWSEPRAKEKPREAPPKTAPLTAEGVRLISLGIQEPPAALPHETVPFDSQRQSKELGMSPWVIETLAYTRDDTDKMFQSAVKNATPQELTAAIAALKPHTPGVKARRALLLGELEGRPKVEPGAVEQAEKIGFTLRDVIPSGGETLMDPEQMDLIPARANPAATAIQSIVFPKNMYTVRAARSWLKAHGYKHKGKVDSTKEFHRFRQTPPSKTRYQGFRWITFGKGIRAVVGIKKGAPRKAPARSRRGNPLSAVGELMVLTNPVPDWARNAGPYFVVGWKYFDGGGSDLYLLKEYHQTLNAAQQAARQFCRRHAEPDAILTADVLGNITYDDAAKTVHGWSIYGALGDGSGDVQAITDPEVLAEYDQTYYAPTAPAWVPRGQERQGPWPWRRNPIESQVSGKAMKAYQAFHGVKPAEIKEMPGDPAPPAKELVVLGTLVDISYMPPGHSELGKGPPFRHPFGTDKKGKIRNPKLPMLATDPDGKQLYIVGGRYDVGPAGIVG